MTLQDSIEQDEMRRFINRLRILHSMETFEIDPDKVMPARAAQFVRTPVPALLRMDDRKQAMVWAALRKREGA